MNNLSIIVPFRHREDHLRTFIPYMNTYLPEAEIYIIEQADSKPFNRGKLLNVGYLSVGSYYYIFHDIDKIPVAVSYLQRENVTQLAFSDIQISGYLGGVTMFEMKAFAKSGGYHNDYFHRAEDNEMMFNLKAKGIPVLNRPGIFKTLPHERTGPEFIHELWEKAQLPRTVNMLETCKYELISKEAKEGFTLIKVLI